MAVLEACFCGRGVAALTASTTTWFGIGVWALVTGLGMLHCTFVAWTLVFWSLCWLELTAFFWIFYNSLQSPTWWPILLQLVQKSRIFSYVTNTSKLKFFLFTRTLGGSLNCRPTSTRALAYKKKYFLREEWSTARGMPMVLVILFKIHSFQYSQALPKLEHWFVWFSQE